MGTVKKEVEKLLNLKTDQNTEKYGTLNNHETRASNPGPRDFNLSPFQRRSSSEFLKGLF